MAPPGYDFLDKGAMQHAPHEPIRLEITGRYIICLSGLCFCDVAVTSPLTLGSIECSDKSSVKDIFQSVAFAASTARLTQRICWFYTLAPKCHQKTHKIWLRFFWTLLTTEHVNNSDKTFKKRSNILSQSMHVWDKNRLTVEMAAQSKSSRSGSSFSIRQYLQWHLKSVAWHSSPVCTDVRPCLATTVQTITEKHVNLYFGASLSVK